MHENPLLHDLELTVAHALAEDIGSGDITAELIPEGRLAQARCVCREHAIICGEPWVNEVFRQIDPGIEVEWVHREGERINPDETVFLAHGPARALLTAERTALNFLQTISSAATSARLFADLVRHTEVKILDTRKTIPGLRLAQKYAVKVGGCSNHRIGLYDAFLIKENHITACGGITNAINNARRLYPEKPVEVEVENLSQLEEALQAGVDVVLLDNFSLEMIRQAVTQTAGRAKLEASGGYNSQSVVVIAETGIDYISVGSLTKHVKATDFTMLFS
ncbi:MAG: carboxylating nicotinate-nucleotide diphosphorylase [Pseudohongiellaceae bacterium]